jgi:DNA-binding beta-propeller fold protein YncE
MEMHKSVLPKRLRVFCAIWVLLPFVGCQSDNVEPPRVAPVFFPPPPETPRLQFLKSFSGPDDLGAVSTSAFERFVLGEPELRDGIITPYGVAIFEGKMYVCDVGKRMVEVLDLKKRTFSYMTRDRRLMNPVNIFIEEDGTKYVADPTAGAVFVFDRNDTLSIILGKDLGVNPIDVVVRGALCYITDFRSNQVVVLDKTTGREIARMGKAKDNGQGQTRPLNELPPGVFSLISDLTLDQEGSIYVTDKAAARITQFDRTGTIRRTIGRLGDNIDEFVRPKGIAIDNADRIWVVDTATEVAKIYDQQARLLLFFGLPGNEPGMMNLPAKIVLDYDNIDLFQPYAVEGANIEFLVLVSNQYGPNKISVYGFGTFPVQQRVPDQTSRFLSIPESEPREAPDYPNLVRMEPTKPDRQSLAPKERIAGLYHESMAFYRAGQHEKAREGLIEVLNSGQIPADMVKAIESTIAEIDRILTSGDRQKQIAELYYRSMALYRTGRFEEAREGLVEVIRSGQIPPAMVRTIEQYLADINNRLAGGQGNRRR